VSVVIPVYNEAERLVKTFGGLLSYVPIEGITIAEVIFVNDGSTDETRRLLIQYKQVVEEHLHAKVRVLSYDHNRGKGYAVKMGMLGAESEYALMLDADMSTPLGELKKVVPLMIKQSRVIIGTRKNGESTVQIAQPWVRQQMGKVFTKMTQMILGTKVTDFTCGFKLFHTSVRDDIFERSRIERWGYDAEILFLANQLDVKVHEKALLWYNDERSRVNLLRDSIRSFYELLKIWDLWIIGAYRLPRRHDMLIRRVAAWAFQT
jgi:dolichyl-phosphate beta-glucosyltransferase